MRSVYATAGLRIVRAACRATVVDDADAPSPVHINFTS